MFLGEAVSIQVMSPTSGDPKQAIMGFSGADNKFPFKLCPRLAGTDGEVKMKIGYRHWDGFHSSYVPD